MNMQQQSHRGFTGGSKPLALHDHPLILDISRHLSCEASYAARAILVLAQVDPGKPLVWVDRKGAFVRMHRKRSAYHANITRGRLPPFVKMGNSSVISEFELEALDRAYAAGFDHKQMVAFVKLLVALRGELGCGPVSEALAHFCGAAPLAGLTPRIERPPIVLETPHQQKSRSTTPSQGSKAEECRIVDPSEKPSRTSNRGAGLLSAQADTPEVRIIRRKEPCELHLGGGRKTVVIEVRKRKLVRSVNSG